MQNQGYMPGKYPAVIKDYDKVTRTCRVEIPGITDGGDMLPIAEIMYPLGDKSMIVEGKIATEIEILVGDLVWVEFMGCDPRYPLIVGYRNPNTNNAVDWRRWHHANIEQIADGTQRLLVGNASITMINGNITIAVGSSTIVITESGIQLDSARIDLN